MERVIAAVLAEDFIEVVLFDNVDDAQALIANAEESGYGATWELFDGTIDELSKVYVIDKNKLEAAIPVTRETAREYLNDDGTIWDMSESDDRIAKAMLHDWEYNV